MGRGRRRGGALRLTREDYAMDASALAQELIGRVLVREAEGVRASGVIVETEAYLGAVDLAAHAVGARYTERTAPMFGPPGTSYVFLTYGVHHCFNIAASVEGDPQAVLVRALEPLEGAGAMRERRGAKRRTRVRDRDLCSGPGKLCEALGIDRTLSGVDLCAHGGIWLERGVAWRERGWALGNGPRIGVDYAGDWATKPLRWWVEGNEHVSR